LYEPSKKRYCVEHLPLGCGLGKFFESRSEPGLFDIDHKCREDWLRVVSDLKDSNLDYRKISGDGCKNELGAHLINSAYVLKNISGWKGEVKIDEKQAG
jgi:hypothetical protein